MTNPKFDLDHHGDEIIVRQAEKSVYVFVKIQKAANEYMSLRLSFSSRTEMRDLLPVILKAYGVAR